MIRHIVLLRFRSDVTAEQRHQLFQGLAGLRRGLPGILDFHAGPNISVEGPLTRGFNDGFWFDFSDEAARDAYLADPEHQAIGTRIVAALEGGADGIVVFDIAR